MSEVSLDELPGTLDYIAVAENGEAAVHLAGGEVIGIKGWNSRTAATAELTDYGWTSVHERNGLLFFEPPKYTAPLGSNTACMPSSERLTIVQSREVPIVDIVVHETYLRTVGKCYGFSFRPHGKAVCGDPVMSIVTSGLVRVACIGHYTTDDVTIYAAEDFLRKLRGVFGEALDRLIQISIEHGRIEHGRREEGKG